MPTSTERLCAERTRATPRTTRKIRNPTQTIAITAIPAPRTQTMAITAPRRQTMAITTITTSRRQTIEITALR